MTPPSQDILIVVPCLNEERSLAGVLDQLLADAASDRSLIVVADGGSRDMSRAIVESYVADHPGRVVLLHNPRRFQSAAVNLAVDTYGAGRSWVVRIDAHARYPKDYVAGLIASAQRSGADSVVVPMRSVGGGCIQAGIAAAQNSVFGTGGSAHRHPGRSAWVDHGHHALFRRDAFLAVDGYDPSFSHNEDAELDRRLTDSGHRIWLDGELGIEYMPRSTFGELLKQYYAYGKGRARTAMLHQMPLKMRQLIPLMIAPIILASAGVLLTPLAALPLLAWLTACVVAALWLTLQERSLCAMAAAPALMAMHAGWAFGFWRQLLTPEGRERKNEAAKARLATSSN